MFSFQLTTQKQSNYKATKNKFYLANHVQHTLLDPGVVEFKLFVGLAVSLIDFLLEILIH
jgi:hypothetical protein